MELKLTLRPDGAQQFGVKLLCAPDGEEETVVTYDNQQQAFVIDFEKASRDKTLVYTSGSQSLKPGHFKQVIPYALDRDHPLQLDIFVDRSVLEIFVNGDICIVQRVYPTRRDSQQVRLFSNDGPLTASHLLKWGMDATNPW